MPLGHPHCLLLADIGAEDELHGLRQEAPQLVGLPDDQALIGDPEHGSDRVDSSVSGRFARSC